MTVIDLRSLDDSDVKEDGRKIVRHFNFSEKVNMNNIIRYHEFN